ncbi:MAG: undecaprenyl diphosphate synthase [Parcubacteria group bacterium Gr01-1014_46]|nr:MAG: undecaprenyl diphosphate synthase [Parcubacteria group bacterium Gr01-1014_46]
MSTELKIPNCVGIILDGNRRWAIKNGLPKLEGHRIGLLKTLKNTTLIARDFGVKHLVVYMFSTENWNREPIEVSYLMDLFREAMKKEILDLGKEGVRVRFVGQRERFSPDLQEAMSNTERETENNTKITLWPCLSYGGRAEILEATKKIKESGEEINEENFGKYLWTAGMPDPDIIIRTSGEQRLSGFLTWQSVYSELFFTQTPWPDFSKEEFEKIIEEYGERERRMGK